MAFYGNITNTSKTTFQFDKTYSNKYEMDLRAGTDGVFVGRYVLVDYDVDVDDNSYLLDSNDGNTNLYLLEDGRKRGNFNLYNAEPYFEKDATNRKLYTAPDPYTFHVFNKDIDNGRVLILYPGHVITETNGSSVYYKLKKQRLTGVSPSDYIWEVEASNSEAYFAYWQAKKAADKIGAEAYRIVILDETTYEPFTFYEYNESGHDYTICTDKTFDKDKTYYDLIIGDNTKLGVVKGNNTLGVEAGIFYGEGLAVEGAIYRVNPGCKYTINTDIEYWAITGWDKDTRWVENPDYNGAEEKDESNMATWPFIEQEIDIPLWGQLAAKADFESASGNPAVDFVLGGKDGSNYDVDESYVINYTIDRTYYGTSRGYDSTVWQKVFENGRDKYVMIAELNSVVPTFDVEADAPTQVPLTPHFDPDSTNVYYKLHVQPSWGFRTKFSSPLIQVPKIDKNGVITDGKGSSRINNKYYPSDQTTTWESDFYDKYNDEKSHKFFNARNEAWEDSEPADEIPAAIYFNKKGFNPAEVVYSSDLVEKGKPNYNIDIHSSGWKNVDKIEITPTGHSGQLYDNHGFGSQTTLSADTQEFSVMLPSIGDAIAKVWDIVFGDRDTNDIIYQTNRRNMDYAWEDARKGLDRRGLRMVGTSIWNGYNKSEVNTLAGCINSIHDLMGMIIAEITPEQILATKDDLDEDYLYYVTKGTSSTPPEPGSELYNLHQMQGQYVMKHRGYEYTPVSNTDEKIYTYTPVEEDDDNFNYSLYYVKDGNSYRPAKEGDKGPFYAKTLGSVESFTPENGLEPFDGTLYYYNDGCSIKDVTGDDKLRMSDWVREPEYQNGREYYSITPNMLEAVNVHQEFQANVYYYRDDETGDYILSDEEKANPSTTYYVINPNKLIDIEAVTGIQNVYSPGVYFYQDGENYYINTDDDGVLDDGTRVVHYYAIRKTNNQATEQIQTISFEKAEKVDAENFDPSSYYINTAMEGQQPVYEALTPDAKYDATQTYYYKVVKLEIKPTNELYEVGAQVNLTPYHKNIFYRQVVDRETGLVTKYQHLTPSIIREIATDENNTDVIYAFGIVPGWDSSTAMFDFFNPDDPALADKTNPELWAATPQKVFYVPGLYHYKNGTDDYSDYILDIYPTMWHKGSYYTFKAGKKPIKVNKKFYEPYKYYTKVGDEFVLIKDNLSADELKDLVDSNNIFAKDTYYVYEDKAKIFQEGAEWNSNVTTVPPTVTLATRKEKTQIRPLEGFARDTNTIHGLLMLLNRKMLNGDIHTRDERTLQGAINSLNDKIAQFGKQTPNQVMVVDNYGRTQSAQTNTLQASTAGLTKGTDVADSENVGILADRYKQVDTVEAMRDQWVTVNIDSDTTNPKFIVHHNFQPVKNDPFTTNLNDGTNTIVLYNPIVDKMGHVVGDRKNTVTLPYGFKFFSTNGVADVATQLTTNTTQAIADNTQDEFQVYSGNKWIRMAVTDGDTNRLTIAHEIHTPTTTAKDLTDLDNSQTFTIQDIQFDEAGHVTHNQPHTYRLPDGVKYIAVGAASTSVANGASAAGTLEANDHVATFSITPNNRWITLQATPGTDTLSIGHAFAGSDANRLYGDAGAQTPKFGATFKVPYFGVDEAGHVKTQSDHTVTIPLPSLTDGTGDVMTGLSLVPEDGKFTVTKTNVGKLKISDFTLGTDDGAVSNEDSINVAFAKLQVQMNKEVAAREQAIELEIENRNTAITEEIAKLDSVDNIEELTLEGEEAPTNLVVGAVSQEDGVVTVTYRQLEEADLPATTVTSATEFTYNYEEPVLEEEESPEADDENGVTPAAENGEILEDETTEEEIVEIPAKTIQWLFDKVAALEARIYQLENPYALSHPIEEVPETPSEGGEESGETPVE